MDLLEAVVVKLVVGPEGGQGAHAHAVGKEYLEREWAQLYTGGHAVGKEYLERERVGTTLYRWARFFLVLPSSYMFKTKICYLLNLILKVRIFCMANFISIAVSTYKNISPLVTPDFHENPQLFS